jgi:diphthine synthase
MFYLIGIGLKPGHLTLEARQAIAGCAKVFLDAYTSRYSEGTVGELGRLVGKEMIRLDRKGVEEGFSLILREAAKTGESIALLVFGNPLNATTHIQLLLDAKKLGVKAGVVPGLSVFDFLGKSGLDTYKFGRVCTIVSPGEKYSPESFYAAVEKNFGAGLHTLCLLDIGEGNSFMTVSEGLSVREKIEKKRRGSLLGKAVIVGFYGLGGKDEKTKAGNLNELKRSSYAGFPQSFVVAGQLNEKEKEALRAMADWHG